MTKEEKKIKNDFTNSPYFKVLSIVFGVLTMVGGTIFGVIQANKSYMHETNEKVLLNEQSILNLQGEISYKNMADDKMKESINKLCISMASLSQTLANDKEDEIEVKERLKKLEADLHEIKIDLVKLEVVSSMKTRSIKKNEIDQDQSLEEIIENIDENCNICNSIIPWDRSIFSQ